MSSEKLPLEGIRVLDCTHYNSGPLAMRFLADLGAEVIKIESIQHPDPSRTGVARRGSGEMPPQFWERAAEGIYCNRNKYGVTLDLSRPEGVAIFEALLAKSQIVAENLRPGVWERFGLGYERLQEINPSIIFLQMPGYGTSGPWKDHACWALPVDQMSGFSSYTGYTGGNPLSHALWSDYANGLHVAFALLAALWKAKSTNEAQRIDLSQLEVVTAMNAEFLLDYQLNGRVWQPNGNAGRHGMSPHGCFPCRGEEQWITIAVEDDRQWQAMRTLLDGREWTKDERFATRSGRLASQDALNDLVAAWTVEWDKWELTERLQAVGVAAFPVLTGGEVTQVRPFWDLDMLEEVDRAVVGRQTYVGSPFRYSETQLRTRMPAPTLGEHNRMILRDLAGVSDELLTELEEQRIIGSIPLGVSGG